MRTLHKVALLLGISAGTTLLQSPVQAGTVAPVAACPVFSSALSGFLATGFSCTVGDKNFSDFTYSFTGAMGNPTPNDIAVTISTTAGGQLYTALFAPTTPGSWMGGSGSIGYKITVNTLSTDVISQVSGAVNSSIPSADYTWSTTASGSVAPPATCAGDESVNSCTGVGSNPIPLALPGVLSTDVVNNFAATNDGIQSIQNTVVQTAVPGPLPLLGAGAAFGFSRKLRSRIKASA